MSPDLLQQQVHTKKQSLREPESEGRRALFRKMSGLPEVKEAKINVVLEKALLERARKKKEVKVFFRCASISKKKQQLIRQPTQHVLLQLTRQPI